MNFYKFFIKKKNLKQKNFLLKKNPQKKGFVRKLKLISPRKPNCGKRSCVLIFFKIKRLFYTYILGKGHNLKKFSKVLIRGEGVKDLPNVNYCCIRGKYDLCGILLKKRRKSIYGTKKI
jgi:small subunit ribosomal protein S12